MAENNRQYLFFKTLHETFMKMIGIKLFSVIGIYKNYRRVYYSNRGTTLF